MKVNYFKIILISTLSLLMIGTIVRLLSSIENEGLFNVGDCGYYIEKVDYLTGQSIKHTMKVIEENEGGYKIESQVGVFWMSKSLASAYKKVDCNKLF